MEQKIYQIIASRTSATARIQDNMNLYHDLGARPTDIEGICCEIERTFGIQAGTFRYLLQYFDKLCVSDLIKVTRGEITHNKLNMAPAMSLFEKMRQRLQKMM